MNLKNSRKSVAFNDFSIFSQGTPQSIQLVSSLQKSVVRPSATQNQGNKTLQPVSPRGILNAQKNTLKASGNSGNVVNTGHGNQMLTFAAQQQVTYSILSFFPTEKAFYKLEKKVFEVT